MVLTPELFGVMKRAILGARVITVLIPCFCSQAPSPRTAKLGDGRVGQGKVQFAAYETADVFLGALGGFGGHIPGQILSVIVDDLSDGPSNNKEGPPGGAVPTLKNWRSEVDFSA